VSGLDFLAPAARAALEELIDRCVTEAVERRLGEREENGRRSPYLTIPEAAELLRCSRQRVDDLLSQRRLRRYKDGARTLVLRAEIEAHLEASGV
jgi:excisionase family DNA binding protein